MPYKDEEKRKAAQKTYSDKWYLANKEKTAAKKKEPPKMITLMLPESEYIKIRYRLNKMLSAIKKPKKELINARAYILSDALMPGIYKIGKSSDPKGSRERTLEAQKPSIDWLFYTEQNVEKIIHKRYADKHVRGDWYRLTEEELEQIIKDYNFIKVLNPEIENSTKITRKHLREEQKTKEAQDAYVAAWTRN